MNAILQPVEPRLTEAHREFLNDPGKAPMLCKDFVLYFIRTFNLSPHVAGRLLGQWVREL